MSPFVFAAVLLAALLHAGWNAVVKRGSDTLLTTALVAGFAGLVSLAVLPFVPAPAAPSWPFIAASTLCQLLYFVLLARTYRVAELSQAYPLMRGTAPLLVAMASAVFPGEPLSAFAWLGIGLICAGIISMAAGWRATHGAGMRLALVNAVVIAAYTMIDGLGVRRSGAPAGYALWLFALTGGLFILGVLALRPRALREHVSGHWRSGLVGGAGTAASYGIVLWAMTAAPVAIVAALRETSILFATILSAVILKERLTPARIAAACAIVAGAAVLRLA